MKFADYLSEMGLNDREFAERAGMDKTYVQKLRVGERTPSVATITRIQEATKGAVMAADWVEA